MEDIISLLFSLAFVGIPFCGFAIIFAGFIALFVWVIRKSASAPTAAEQKSALDDAQAWVNGKAPSLTPWSVTLLNDLSAEWNGTYTRFIELKGKGTIRLYSTGADVIAFAMVRRSGDFGLVVAATTANRWRIQFGGGFAQVYRDSAALGQWRLGDGEIFDASSQSIGSARRGSGLTFFINGIPTDWKDRFYDVTLNGRKIGAINNAPEGAGLFRSISGAGTPKLAYTAESFLDRNAEDWLMALAIIETAYYSVLERANASRARLRH